MDACPDAACVEMEGGAVAQVCVEYGVPFSVVRIMSDSASGDAVSDFGAFMEKVASNYCKAVCDVVVPAVAKVL